MGVYPQGSQAAMRCGQVPERASHATTKKNSKVCCVCMKEGGSTEPGPGVEEAAREQQGGPHPHVYHIHGLGYPLIRACAACSLRQESPTHTHIQRHTPTFSFHSCSRAACCAFALASFSSRMRVPGSKEAPAPLPLDMLFASRAASTGTAAVVCRQHTIAQQHRDRHPTLTTLVGHRGNN